jgi:hypothetical protein
VSNVQVVSPAQSYRSATVTAFLAEAQEFGVRVSLADDSDMGALKVMTAVMQRIRHVEARLDALEQARP